MFQLYSLRYFNNEKKIDQNTYRKIFTHPVRVPKYLTNFFPVLLYVQEVQILRTKFKQKNLKIHYLDLLSDFIAERKKKKFFLKISAGISN